MKKLYTFITLAAAALTATAQTEDEVWTSIGFGKIHNTMYEYLVGTQNTTSYELEIEETEIEGGKKYRCQPLASESNPLYGYYKTDDVYMYFYVMDNGNHYMEKFSAFNDFVITSQDVKENGTGGSTYNAYATFEDGEFIIPVRGIRLEGSPFRNPGVWFQGNYTTPVTITFPDAKDFSVELHTYVCADEVPGGTDGNDQMFICKGNDGASYIKFGYITGYREFTLNDETYIAEHGKQGDTDAPIRCGANAKPGIYTAYVASFNAKDQIKQIASSYFLITKEDDENWEYAGKAKWNEAFFTGYHNTWSAPNEEMTAKYEENTAIPGYYRIVNPYENHSMADNIYSPCASHNHYIYIDATDPEKVKIEPSALGVDAGEGKGIVMSRGYFLETHSTVSHEEIKDAGYYGTMTENKISFPAQDIMFHEKNSSTGLMTTSSAPLELTLHPRVPATGISISSEEETVNVGETVTLTATVEPEDATDVELTWTSSDEAIATVDENGVVSAIAPGEATVTVSCDGLSASCLITVPVPPVKATAIILPTEETVKIGASVDLTATVEPEDAEEVELTWTSSDEAIATVDDKGTVTGIAPGEATITVSCGELSASCLVTVTDTNVMISEIGVKAAAERFDLMGRRTATDAKGLMIVRQGNKIVKTVIR